MQRFGQFQYDAMDTGTIKVCGICEIARGDFLARRIRFEPRKLCSAVAGRDKRQRLIHQQRYSLDRFSQHVEL